MLVLLVLLVSTGSAILKVTAFMVTLKKTSNVYAFCFLKSAKIEK